MIAYQALAGAKSNKMSVGLILICK